MEERRRYFRIDDELCVAMRPLANEELQVISRDQNTFLSAHFDNRIATLLEACRVQNPIAAEILSLLNQKINLLATQLEVDSAQLTAISFHMRQVNISACGMALHYDQAFPVGQPIQLDLRLQESDLLVSLVAKVVACEPQHGEQDGYFLRLNFEHIRPHDQELLIQYVVRRQNTQLRRRSEDDHDSSQ